MGITFIFKPFNDNNEVNMRAPIARSDTGPILFCLKPLFGTAIEVHRGSRGSQGHGHLDCFPEAPWSRQRGHVPTFCLWVSKAVQCESTRHKSPCSISQHSCSLLALEKTESNVWPNLSPGNVPPRSHTRQWELHT